MSKPQITRSTVVTTKIGDSNSPLERSVDTFQSYTNNVELTFRLPNATRTREEIVEVHITPESALRLAEKLADYSGHELTLREGVEA